jgi:hypothetical protein
MCFIHGDIVSFADKLKITHVLLIADAKLATDTVGAQLATGDETPDRLVADAEATCDRWDIAQLHGMDVVTRVLSVALHGNHVFAPNRLMVAGGLHDGFGVATMLEPCSSKISRAVCRASNRANDRNASGAWSAGHKAPRALSPPDAT